MGISKLQGLWVTCNPHKFEIPALQFPYKPPRKSLQTFAVHFLMSKNVFLKILALCIVNIQERFQIKNRLWWCAYSNQNGNWNKYLECRNLQEQIRKLPYCVCWHDLAGVFDWIIINSRKSDSEFGYITLLLIFYWKFLSSCHHS